jgi:hypothetical protein
VVANGPADWDRISSQPDLARLDADGVDVAGVIALLGYVGPSPDERIIRLHPHFGDLSVSIDIAVTDVILTREAPAAILPWGGVVVWVSRTADVTVRRTRTATAKAQQVKQFFGTGPAAQASTADPSDRLNIRVRQDRVPPVYDCKDCQSKECGGTSQCLTPCTSHPV